MTAAYNRDRTTDKMVVPSANSRFLGRRAALAAALAAIGAGTALGVAAFDDTGWTSNQPVTLVAQANGNPVAPQYPEAATSLDRVQRGMTMSVPLSSGLAPQRGGEPRECRDQGRPKKACWVGPPDQGEPPAPTPVTTTPPPTTDPTPPPPPPDTGKPDQITGLPSGAGDLLLPPPNPVPPPNPCGPKLTYCW